MENKHLIIGAVSLVAAASSGGAIGYLVAKKQLRTQYEDLASREIAEAREFFAAQYKTDEYSSPSKAAEKLNVDEPSDAEIAMAEYQGQKVNVVSSKNSTAKVQVIMDDKEEDEVEVVVENNIFVNGEPLDPDAFDIEAELEHRQSNVCYVLSLDEYSLNEENYETTTLTYFANSDTLIDEDEKPIDDVEETIGRSNLNRFGHGSGDVDIVFVANEARHMAYEILRSEGSYEEEVLGLTPDHLEHSDDRMRRRHHGWSDE